MICKQCGAQCIENSNFCMKCGARIEGMPRIGPVAGTNDMPMERPGELKRKLAALPTWVKWAVLAGAFMFVVILLVSFTGADPASDFEYVFADGDVVITGYLGTSRKIHVPSRIEGRPVTQIGERAFQGYDMTSIILPDSVTIIHDRAFYECATLESISMDGVETIGTQAFSRCDSLTEMDFPQSVKRIESGAFMQCDGLQEVKLPDGLEFLGYGSFAVCENLAWLNIPDDFTGFDMEIVQFYGKKIFTPCYNRDTVLVVKEGSEAHMLLIQYGFGEIDYVVR